MTRWRRTTWAGAVTALAAAALAGCVRLPTTGPVVEAHANGQADQVQGPYSNPPPPQPGQSPVQIVDGFLNAMTATPIQTRVAQKFLTPAAQARWQPKNGVIVYSAPATPRGGARVRVRLIDARALGPQGDWQGRLSQGASRLDFPMRPEHGQWRIAAAPNALIVPDVWYQQHFQNALIYFFDPTGRILVPELVHLPEGDQFATALVRSLLTGPSDALRGVARSFVPPGLTAGLSVTVSAQGVANVSLRGALSGPLSQRTMELMTAQLAWTLRQVPGVKSFEVTIGGRQLSDRAGESTFSVRSGDQFDPTDGRASAQLYALRDGRLVSGQPHRLTAVDGPFGSQDQGIGAFAVSLDDTRIAGVTPYRLLVGPVRGGSGVREVLNGPGTLLRPSWDFAGRLWDVARAPGGAQFVCITGTQVQRVRVPGVTGRDVRRFLVSRDGSRLVAVVHGARTDRLVVSRLRYSDQGRVLGASDTRTLGWRDGGSARIRDVGWLSPTTVAVLHQLTQQYAEVRQIAVDGSTPQSQASAATLDLTRQSGAQGAGNIPGRVTGLATSPVDSVSAPTAPQTSFAILSHSLVDLDQSAGTRPVPIRRLTHITYAG